MEKALEVSMEIRGAYVDQLVKLNGNLKKERKALRMSEARGRKPNRELATCTEALSACRVKTGSVEGKIT